MRHFTSSYSLLNPLIGTLKPQTNSNRMIGTLTVDGWAVTFGTARRGLGVAAAPPRNAQCNSPPITGQCTNSTVFDVAL